MNKDDYVSNALLEWERNWREGKDVAAEILCREHPEWASELEARITALKATDWLHDLQEELAPTSETEVHRSIRKPSSAFPLPKSSLTAEELARAIWERELLSREEIQHFCESQSEETIQNANRLAEALLGEDK